MDRRAFLASLGAAVVAPGCAMRRVAARDAEPAPRPNVVMVLSDDHTKTDTGCYGSTAVRTPHIDRLAREGMRFRNAFTATAMCVPSRATLYTGLYPMRHGAWPNHSRVFDGVRSLPHLLEPLGYRTAIAGKTHFRPAECFPFEILCSPGDVTSLRLGAVEKFLAGVGGQPFCLFVCTTDPHVPWPEESAYEPDRVGMPPYLIDTPATRKWMSRYYAEVYLNGQPLASLAGYSTGYLDRPLDAAALRLLRPGRNVLAVHCRQSAGGQYIDADILAK